MYTYAFLAADMYTFCSRQIPAHLDDFSTRSANADVLNFFDQMSTRDSHGNLLPNPQFKVAKAQQLAKKHLHHGYSTQVCVCGVTRVPLLPSSQRLLH